MNSWLTLHIINIKSTKGHQFDTRFMIVLKYTLNYLLLFFVEM